MMEPRFEAEQSGSKQLPFNYSVSPPPLGRQKENWKVPGPQPPAHQRTIPTSRSEDAPGLMPHVLPSPRAQGMAQVTFPQAPPCWFSTQLTLSIPGPQHPCHTLTPTLCSLQDFLTPPTPQTPRKGAATPRPGSFATTRRKA